MFWQSLTLPNLPPHSAPGCLVGMLLWVLGGCGPAESEQLFCFSTPPVAPTEAGVVQDDTGPTGSVPTADAGADDADARAARDGSGSAPESGTLNPTRRHVILVIGDGLQLAHEIATSRYLTGRDDGLSFHAFPVVVFKTTWNLDVYNAYASALDVRPYAPLAFDPTVGYDPALGGSAPYPLLPDNEERRDYFLNGWAAESASTATAMSTGVKTESGNLAWLPGDPEDCALETSAEFLRRVYGMAIGFVTTGYFPGATPAAWFSHNPDRGWSDEIAHEMLTQVRPDVIIGGGIDYADPSDLEAARAGDYLLVEQDSYVDGSVALLAGAIMAKQEQKRLLGLFSHVSFVAPMPVDRPGSPLLVRESTETPTLAAASIAALEVLSRDADGFFLLVEQAGIDAANHGNDFRSMIGCVQDLSEAVAAMVAFVNRPDDAVDWTNTTVLVTADHANSYLRLERALGRGDLPTQEGSSYPDGDVTYGTFGHTNELTTVYARGMAAAELTKYATVYPGLNIIDDTSVYRFTLQAGKR
jgi:alkaline phosphatase